MEVFLTQDGVQRSGTSMKLFQTSWRVTTPLNISFCYKWYLIFNFQGIDVDKWDYFLRDSLATKVQVTSIKLDIFYAPKKNWISV